MYPNIRLIFSKRKKNIFLTLSKSLNSTMKILWILFHPTFLAILRTLRTILTTLLYLQYLFQEQENRSIQKGYVKVLKKHKTNMFAYQIQGITAL